MREKYGQDFWPDRPFNRFIDAFYGAGSMSHWVLQHYPETEFVINDQNAELIQMYEVIRDHPQDFIRECQDLESRFLAITDSDAQAQKNRRHEFYTATKMAYIRDYVTMGKVKESASLFFMMKTCFNGWWKTYNYSNGRYATPPGTLLEKKTFIDVDLINRHSQFFNNHCTILTGDFENVRSYINSDTYVYFDPPYRDSTTEYTEEGFTDREQIRLCELFKYADAQGACVSLSNKEIGDGFFETHLNGFEMLVYDVKYTAGRGVTLNQVKENFVRNFASAKQPSNDLFIFE